MCAAGLLLALGVVGGCDESPPTGPSLNEEFTLAPGEITPIAGAGVRIRFDQVEGDSRCPADAVCVQGGDALVHLAVVERSTERPYELHTGNMEPVTHDVSLDREPTALRRHDLGVDHHVVVGRRFVAPVLPADVELDVTEVKFIDSTGIRVVVDALQRFSEANRAFRLISPLPAQMHRVLEVAGLLARLPLSPPTGLA